VCTAVGVAARGTGQGMALMVRGAEGGGVVACGRRMALRAAVARFPAVSLASCLSTVADGESQTAATGRTGAEELTAEEEEGGTTRTGTGRTGVGDPGAQGAGAASGGGGGAKSENAEAAALRSQVEGLKKSLDELKGKVAELQDSKLRALAELENVRRIAQRDVDTARVYSIQKFAKQLLDVSDNLQRALQCVPEDKRSGESDEAQLLSLIYVGVDGTRRELGKIFSSYDITEFGEPGDKFDPHLHEAMFQVPASADVPAGHVASVIKSGYRFKDRILRPAQVGTTK
jgi:molecular chaperone GrpE